MKFETPALSNKCTVKTKKNLQSRHVYRENTPLRNLGLLVKHVEPRTEKQSGKHTKKKLDVDRKEKKHNMNKKSIFKKKNPK